MLYNFWSVCQTIASLFLSLAKRYTRLKEDGTVLTLVESHMTAHTSKSQFTNFLLFERHYNTYLSKVKGRALTPTQVLE